MGSGGSRYERRHGHLTLAESAIRRGGFREGLDALVWITMWGTYRESGAAVEGFKVADVADWWGASQSHSYRRQQVFRKLFPEHRTPDGIIDFEANEQYRDQLGKVGRRLARMSVEQRSREKSIEDVATELGFGLSVA